MSLITVVTIQWELPLQFVEEGDIARVCVVITDGVLKRDLSIEVETADSLLSPQATSKEVIHSLST